MSSILQICFCHCFSWIHTWCSSSLSLWIFVLLLSTIPSSKSSFIRFFHHPPLFTSQNKYKEYKHIRHEFQNNIKFSLYISFFLSSFSIYISSATHHFNVLVFFLLPSSCFIWQSWFWEKMSHNTRKSKIILNNSSPQKMREMKSFNRETSV